MKRTITLLWLTVSMALLWGGNAAQSQTDFWRPTNGPYAGDIEALAVSSNGTVFAGGFGSIYLSKDDGESWIPANNGIDPRFLIKALAFNSYEHLFAGSLGTVYCSTDTGRTWSTGSDGLPQSYVRALVVKANNQILAGTGSGLYRSTDDGASWTPTSLLGRAVYALLIDSVGWIHAGTSAGISRSVDGGLTWSEVFTPGPVVALARDSSGILVAGRNAPSSADPGLLRSTDGGTTWTPATMSPLDGFVRSTTATSNGISFAGTDQGRIFRSIDAGLNWNEVVRDSTATVWALTATATSSLIAGTGTGILRSVNDGVTWDKSNSGLRNTAIYSFAINEGGDLFVGGNAPGLFKSTDGGDSWLEATNGLASPGSRALYVRPLAIDSIGQLFTGTLGGGVFRSVNNGADWLPSNNGLLDGYIWSMVVNSSGYIFAGTQSTGVFRSTDNGTSWMAANSGLGNQFVNDLAVNSNGDVFAATDDGVFISTDNGGSWANSLSKKWIYTITVSASGIVYAGIGSISGGATESGIFKSTDNGNVWAKINNGITDTLVLALIATPSAHVFAGTETRGVFWSTDSGETWEQMNSGLDFLSVNSFVVDPLGFIYVGTWGGGVFRSRQSITSVDHHGLEPLYTFKLLQSFPNPFNPTTTIRYELPRTSYATLKVYDLLGREVATLVNGVEEPGYKSVEWNASGVASGVYFYRLTAGDFVQTRKLLVLK